MVPVVLAAATVGQRAYKLLESNPELKDKALQLFNKGRGSKPLASLLESKDKNVQRGAIKTMFEAGLPADLFLQQAQLTREEAAEYAQLIVAYKLNQSNAVDENQTKRSSTGQAFLDQAVINREIKEICGMLGISSDAYAKLLVGINSHTSADIEKFQLARRLDGLPRI